MEIKLPKLRTGATREDIQYILTSISPIELEVNKEHSHVFDDYWYDYKNESDEIIELNEVPSDKDQASMLETFKGIYKKSFPRWYNDLISWWVHLHLFLNNKTKNFLMDNINKQKMYNDLMNTMLRAKWIKNESWDLVIASRDLHMCNMSSVNSYIDLDCHNSKWNGVAFKNEWYSTHTSFESIEFRLNNVIHEDIDMYYRLIVINNFLKTPVKFMKVSDWLKQKLRCWIQNYHKLSTVQGSDLPYDISIKDIEESFRNLWYENLTKNAGEDYLALMYNFNQLVSLERKVFWTRRLLNYFYFIIKD